MCATSETVYELRNIASSARTLSHKDEGEARRAQIQFGTKGEKEQKKERCSNFAEIRQALALFGC